MPKPNEFTIRVTQPAIPLKRRTAWEIIMLEDCLDPPRLPPRVTEAVLVGGGDPRVFGMSLVADHNTLVQVMLRPTVTNAATTVTIDLLRGTVTGEVPELFLERMAPWPRNRHDRKLRLSLGPERFAQLVEKVTKKLGPPVEDPRGWNNRFWDAISHPKVPQHRKGQKQRRPTS